ncbi:lipopolysaccharide-induced tumor necrosis factor-alpha factor homolog [Clavelina lepadiformis]|uniref:lipopolysaccharide-induced tumor necrosis factor-alpha factor homolog n=1 Tax=Clavelina lepadiformis TaxID=159417 RepID=UPI0040425622
MSAIPPPPPGYNQSMQMGNPYPAGPQAQYNTANEYGIPKQGAVPPPPPPGYVSTAPGPMGNATVIVTQQPRRIFSKFPTNTVCPHCNATVITRPRAEVGTVTWAAAGILILLGCWLGCCIIPFCIDECKDIFHDCPNCQHTIDIYRPL